MYDTHFWAFLGDLLYFASPLLAFIFGVMIYFEWTQRRDSRRFKKKWREQRALERSIERASKS